ncbi:hypothetical protein [Caproicibacterium amylolyticum]|uniref:Uncharacterized protein n=1 Tax=Caproicibacterium amylolyticum TaxID=2766537 RepID=A0A7G9WJU5_9FIRM|nr:hypothetical protein [Caproicibacterium amylolyticum]QNO18957.1 hypothetical protein H6X83_04850 [Caproicibacterium amylolyticum]
MNKFKVGDRVRMVENYKDFSKGCIVTIVETDDSRVPYLAKDEKGNKHWLHESDVAPVEEHTKEKFYVGQRVRIRQFDDMKEEFGINGRGNIGCNETFVTLMEPLCGKFATISSICGKRIGLCSFQNCDDIRTNWQYSTDMIEPADSQTIVIRSDGKVTTAYLKDGHKTVKSAKSACSPIDTFDLYTGADIALKRLLGKPVEEVKAATEPKFKFGIDEKVKVINYGANYPCYGEFVDKYAPQLSKNYRDSNLPLNEAVCRVIRRAKHMTNKGKLLYIVMDMESLQVYVIGEDGLESAE